jgi:hypothetical protein
MSQTIERLYQETKNYNKPKTIANEPTTIIRDIFENRENLLQDCYFLSFAKTYYSIVALPEHTISPKMENLLKTVPRIVIPSKLLNFFFCNALANVIQNYNGTRQSHN